MSDFWVLLIAFVALQIMNATLPFPFGRKPSRTKQQEKP